MAIQKNPKDQDATGAYTVLRSFYWGGDVVEAGSSLQLTAEQAAELKAASKVAPGAPVPAKAAKPQKAAD